MNFTFGDRRDLASAISTQREAAAAEMRLVRGQIRLLDQRLAALTEFVALCDETERSLESDMPQLPLAAHKPDVRAAVIEALRTAPARGVPTNEVTKRVMRRYPLIHTKTPAMTLSRLKKQGVVEQIDGGWRLSRRSGGELN